MKKFNFSRFEFFKLLLQIEIVSCIVDFDNDDYEFVKVFVRFFLSYELFLDFNLKFSFEHIHFEIVVLIRFVEVYFKTLNIIDCKRFLN